MQKALIVLISLLVLNSHGQYDNWELTKPFETTWSKVYSDSAIDISESIAILSSLNTYTIQSEDEEAVYGIFDGLRYPIEEYQDKKKKMPTFLIDANLSGEFTVELLDRGYTVSISNIYSHNSRGTRVYVGAGVTKSSEQLDTLEDYIWKKNGRLKSNFARSILPRLNHLFLDSFNLKKLEDQRAW